MKIEQLEIRPDNIMEILSSSDVYLVKFSKSRTSKSKDYDMAPYGLSFKSLKNASVSDIIQLVGSKEGAVIRVTTEEP